MTPWDPGSGRLTLRTDSCERRDRPHLQYTICYWAEAQKWQNLYRVWKETCKKKKKTTSNFLCVSLAWRKLRGMFLIHRVYPV